MSKIAENNREITENTSKTIDSIIEEFEKEFCNNHQKPIRFLRGIFYDEQDGAEKIEDFLHQALTDYKEEILKLITEEIAQAHLEGDKTSRLTSLFNKIQTK